MRRQLLRLYGRRREAQLVSSGKTGTLRVYSPCLLCALSPFWTLSTAGRYNMHALYRCRRFSPKHTACAQPYRTTRTDGFAMHKCGDSHGATSSSSLRVVQRHSNLFISFDFAVARGPHTTCKMAQNEKESPSFLGVSVTAVPPHTADCPRPAVSRLLL